jgi:hypothetical protein
MNRLDVILRLDERAGEHVLVEAARLDSARALRAARTRGIFRVAASWASMLWCLGCGFESKECPEA